MYVTWVHLEVDECSRKAKGRLKEGPREKVEKNGGSGAGVKGSIWFVSWSQTTALNNASIIFQVKRLTMGLLKAAEDRSPLVHNASLSRVTSQDGYVNEGIIGDQITSTFGESCREALNQFESTSSQQLVPNNTGFDYKRNVFHTESYPGMCIFHLDAGCLSACLPILLCTMRETPWCTQCHRIAQNKI